MNLCVCGHSEKEHSRITCDHYDEKFNSVGISEEIACDCYNFNPAAGVTVAPNDHGVYPWESAEVFNFSVKGSGKDSRAIAICEIYVLQVGIEWLCAADCEFNIGDSSCSLEPLSRDREPHLTRSAALLAAVDRSLRHFHTRDRSGCAIPRQVAASIEIHHKLLALKASIGGGDVAAALPVGTQLDLFGGAA